MFDLLVTIGAILGLMAVASPFVFFCWYCATNGGEGYGHRKGEFLPERPECIGDPTPTHREYLADRAGRRWRFRADGMYELEPERRVVSTRAAIREQYGPLQAFGKLMHVESVSE